jgi:dTDP-4-dehydrorhamnose reductase
VVSNAAAYTGVDKAESERDQIFPVNAKGPRYLVFSCGRRNLPLMRLSTDYVFDGQKRDPYLEADAVCAMIVYGESDDPSPYKRAGRTAGAW